MSTNTESQTGNFLHVSYDLNKLFIFSNSFVSGTFKNNTGGAAAFEPGLVVARDSSDNTIVPFDDDAAANGDDLPIGILAQEVASIADGATVDDINICHKGEVAEELVTFQAADDFDTVVTGGQTVRDNLLKIGIKPVVADELTKKDN